MPLSSGLSALLQAATTQLGQLDGGDHNNRTTNGKTSEVESYGGVTTDDGASSDGGEKLEDSGKHTQTPIIIPEGDPLRHTFPELIMTLAVDPKNNDTIAFLPDGKFFALRKKDFADVLMKEYFPVTTFDEFLELIHEWGFTRLVQDTNDSGIEIFRHPHFIKGDFMKCRGIKFGEDPTHARVGALPEAAKIEYTISDEHGPTVTSIKRRLSPASMKRPESESAANLKKLHSSDDEPPATVTTEAETGPSSAQNRDDIRSLALAVTTEKLNLRREESSSSESSNKNLIDQAVKSATHTIVTDAIEILLKDEVHTKQTYSKHAKELSKSSLPGVVPISKVLFEAKQKEQAEVKKMCPPIIMRRRSSGIEELSIAAAIRAEELREESERELRRSTTSSSVEKEFKPTTGTEDDSSVIPKIHCVESNESDDAKLVN